MEEEAAPQPVKTFPVYACLVLNGLLIAYFLWVLFLQGAPLLQFFAKHGFPQKPEVWKALKPVIVMTMVPFVAVMLSALAVERVSLGRSAGVLFQCLLCLVIASSFPIGTVLGTLGLVLVLIDLIMKKGFGAVPGAFGFAGAGLAAGAALALLLYFTNTLWVVDFSGGARQIGTGLGLVKPAKNQLAINLGLADAPDQKFRGLPDLMKLFGAQKENRKAAAKAKPQAAPPKTAAAQPSGEPAVIVMKNGRVVKGTNLKTETRGYTLTTEDMGDIFFGKEEVASAASAGNAAK